MPKLRRSTVLKLVCFCITFCIATFGITYVIHPSKYFVHENVYSFRVPYIRLASVWPSALLDKTPTHSQRARLSMLAEDREGA